MERHMPKAGVETGGRAGAESPRFLFLTESGFASLVVAFAFWTWSHNVYTHIDMSIHMSTHVSIHMSTHRLIASAHVIIVYIRSGTR